MEKTGAPEIAFLMYLGVRIGSYSPVKIKDERWGNGWLDGRLDKQALTQADLDAIETELRANPPSDLDSNIVIRFFSVLENQIREAPLCKSE
ncbi:MAG: hypothetical protein KGP28_04770 [Bdellovibrionales bacterium]|nr:hypothetical protein [Bdellovibrionales bacterium]